MDLLKVKEALDSSPVVASLEFFIKNDHIISTFSKLIRPCEQ